MCIKNSRSDLAEEDRMKIKGLLSILYRRDENFVFMVLTSKRISDDYVIWNETHIFWSDEDSLRTFHLISSSKFSLYQKGLVYWARFATKSGNGPFTFEFWAGRKTVIVPNSLSRGMWLSWVYFFSPCATLFDPTNITLNDTWDTALRAHEKNLHLVTSVYSQR